MTRPPCEKTVRTKSRKRFNSVKAKRCQESSQFPKVHLPCSLPPSCLFPGNKPKTQLLENAASRHPSNVQPTDRPRSLFFFANFSALSHLWANMYPQYDPKPTSSPPLLQSIKVFGAAFLRVSLPTRSEKIRNLKTGRSLCDTTIRVRMEEDNFSPVSMNFFAPRNDYALLSVTLDLRRPLWNGHVKLA